MAVVGMRQSPVSGNDVVSLQDNVERVGSRLNGYLTLPFTPFHTRSSADTYMYIYIYINIYTFVICSTFYKWPGHKIASYTLWLFNDTNYMILFANFTVND